MAIESLNRFVVSASAPGSPTGLMIIGSPTVDGGDFAMTGPTSQGFSGITAYRIYARTPQGSGAYTLAKTVITGVIDDFSVDTLNSGSAYDLYATAVSSHGESAPSASIQITTL